jgi:hypothetical protein
MRCIQQHVQHALEYAGQDPKSVGAVSLEKPPARGVPGPFVCVAIEKGLSRQHDGLQVIRAGVSGLLRIRAPVEKIGAALQGGGERLRDGLD